MEVVQEQEHYIPQKESAAPDRALSDPSPKELNIHTGVTRPEGVGEAEGRDEVAGFRARALGLQCFRCLG